MDVWTDGEGVEVCTDGKGLLYMYRHAGDDALVPWYIVYTLSSHKTHLLYMLLIVP